jgi:integrase
MVQISNIMQIIFRIVSYAYLVKIGRYDIEPTEGKINQVSPTTFNQWCSTLFTEIVKRRVHPHLFRESRATNLVVHSGKDLEVARRLLGHESSDTTKIYVIREDTDDADEAFI